MTLSGHEAAAVRLLIEMETLRRMLRLYPAGHPALPASRLRVARAAEDLAMPVVSLAFGPDRLFFDQAEIVVANGSPVIRLRQLLCRLGLAAVHLTFPEAVEGITLLVERLAPLHDPPGEDDRERLLLEAGDLPGVELVPLDLSRIQLIEGSDQEAHRAVTPVWAELARRLGEDGSFILADKILSGEFTAEALAELVALSADPSTLFDHLFGRLRASIEGLEMPPRAVVLNEIREFLQEWLALLTPERRHLGVIAAAAHFPPTDELSRDETPLVAVELVLEAVEYFLAARLPVPDAVARALSHLGEAAAEGAGALPAAVAARCRALAARVYLLAGLPEPAQSAADESPPLGTEIDDPSDEVRDSLSDERLRRHLVRLLGEVITLWPTETVAEKASLRLAEELVSSLQLGDLDTAARVTTLLASGRHAEARQMACNTGVDAAMRAFSTTERSEHARLTAILQGLGEEALPAILEALANEENLSTRKRLLEVILQHGDRAVPYLRPLLDDPRWFVVRNVIFVLRRLGDRGIASALKERLADARPQVLSEILKTLIAMEDHQWLPLLLAELGADNEERRLAALGVAARVPHPTVVRGIVDQLRQQTGKKLRDTYAIELIRTLGRHADPAALPELRRILKLRQWLSPFPLTTLRREAALALVAIDTPEARGLAQALANDRDSEVATAVRRALARLRTEEQSS